MAFPQRSATPCSDHLRELNFNGHYFPDESSRVPGCTAPLAGPNSENWPLAGDSQHQLYQHQLHQITSFPICLHPRQRSLLKSCRGVGGFDTHHADIRAGANGRDRRFDTHFADNKTSPEMHTIGFIFTYLLQTATAFSSLNRSKLKYLYLGGTRKTSGYQAFHIYLTLFKISNTELE